MNEILGLLFIGLIIYIWYRNLTVRELAMTHSSHACQKRGVQLLDDSVHLSGLSLSRCPDRRRCLRRRYRFTYSSDNINRISGVTIMLGNQLESIVFSFPSDSLQA